MMRPAPKINSPAAAPMSAPPERDASGVKCVTSMLMVVPVI